MFFRALSVLAILTMLLVTACGRKDNEKPPHVYIGGEIINPYSNFLVLSRNGNLVDTIFLDDKNRFHLKIDSVQEGMYLLKHQAQTQTMYLTPGDSLLLRANTYAFDESLHFSGKGSGRNNFIADMFLLDEMNAELLLSFHKTSPSEFAHKTDSIQQSRLENLKKASEKKKFSPEFVDLAKQIIKYESYDLRERYTYLVHKYYKEHYKKIPADFHEYRKEADFNLERLQTSPGYKRFIDNYLINYSLDWCSESGIDEEDCFKLTNNKNIKARMAKAADLIQLPNLKEHFLSKLAVLGLVMAKNKEDLNEIIELLEKEEFPREDLEHLKALAALQLNYLPGTTIKNIPLITYAGDTIPFKEAVKKPTIIFLWSIYNGRHEQDHQLIRQYRRKYPEIDFIGLNMDIGEVAEWRKTVEKNNYNPQREYQLGRARIKKEFFHYYLNKLLFLDSSGKVIIGDAFIHSPEFESRILEFLNR